RLRAALFASGGRPRSRGWRSPASSRRAADSSRSWGARPRPRRCSTARLAAMSAPGRSSTPPRPCCRDLPRSPPSCSRGFLRKFSTTRGGAKTPRAVFISKLSFSSWTHRFPRPIMANIGHQRSAEGTTAKGGTAGGWSLRMLRGARGRAAIARGARIVAFAVSAATALWVASLAAEPAANGRQTEPAANGRQTEPAANGRQAEPAPNGRLVGNGAGAGTMDQALIQSYQNNPQLNSQRSATRATDENVPTALSGYRPRV